MSNRLIDESSPYLLQHAENPVDWYPWSDAAMRRALAEQKPIFLSIGYSACHWCHVMEHESFESEEIAALLNENFVCIKVDREERPDLDQIYMQAVQMLTGRGGWPMSVFLTPEREPFFGGTYWPPVRRQGLPGFDEVLKAVLDAWMNRRDQAVAQAAELTSRMQAPSPSEADAVGLELLESAAQDLYAQFDFVHGGFGEAPKFPHSMTLQFLLRMWSRDRQRHAGLLALVTKNLDKMAAGGIYDHLAGGFARYSVDADWLVPHFEKMLYDNALLLDAYLDGFLVTQNEEYARVSAEICHYVLGYMTDETGGFHSSEDADSEGVEGKFYVWSWDEVRAVLGDDLGEKFACVYDISETGNFEGMSIPNLPKSIAERAQLRDWNVDQLASEMQVARQQLLAARDRRIRPGKDDKILVSWNGLMIHAMARAGAILNDSRFRQAAVKAAEFAADTLTREDGRLWHTYRHGQVKLDAYLDDYANLANAYVTLYETTFDERWLDASVSLAEILMTHFADEAQGGFFYTADDHESLIARMKDSQDSSLPSGNGMAATVLTRLASLCHREEFRAAAESALRLNASFMKDYPLAVGQLLIAADQQVGPVQQVVLADSRPETALQLHQRYLPRAVLATPGNSPNLQTLVGDKPAIPGEPRLYVCENFGCQMPVVGDEMVNGAIANL